MNAPWPRQLSGTALALLLHLGALAWWLNVAGSKVPPSVPVQTLNVSLISAPEEVPRPPAPAPAPAATPKPVHKTTPRPPRQLATTRRTQAPAAETVPAVSATTEISPAATPAAASAPAELPTAIVPPRFDAAYLANPAPPYPTLSRRLNETGRVLLRVKVNAEGLPSAIDIAQSSGYPRLDEAARAAVGGWKFIPARQGERAVAATVLVPIAFKLN